MSGETGHVAPVAVGREHSRRNFLKTAAWAGAAISAAGIGGFGIAARYANAQGGLPLSGPPSTELGGPNFPAYPSYEGLGDAAILQFAYLLELLEGTFYAEGVQAGIFSGADLEQIATIRNHEMAHADALAATLGDLGAEVPATPQFTYPSGVFNDPVAFLELAATFEPVGIGAYQGAAPALNSEDILAAAGSILGVECQHRTAINVLRGVEPPNDKAFQESLKLRQVQQAVAPFGITS